MPKTSAPSTSFVSCVSCLQFIEDIGQTVHCPLQTSPALVRTSILLDLDFIFPCKPSVGPPSAPAGLIYLSVLRPDSPRLPVRGGSILTIESGQIFTSLVIGQHTDIHQIYPISHKIQPFVMGN